MRISGCTIARNITKYNYPIVESINSILPICDEFIINVGDSEDNTLEIVKSIKDPKVSIIQNKWDFASGRDVLSEQTNIAINECSGDWAFYLQADEVIHEKDLMKLKNNMYHNLDVRDVDALCFDWIHFFCSYFRYRIDIGWFQKQNRIIRNNNTIESCDEAFGFRRKDGKQLNRKRIYTFLYHYGWVQSPETMIQRRINAENIGYVSLTDEQRSKPYVFGDLNKFPIYFGSHPKVMKDRIESHELTEQERDFIKRKFWWYPPYIFKLRYKTFRRQREKINWY